MSRSVFPVLFARSSPRPHAAEDLRDLSEEITEQMFRGSWDEVPVEVERTHSCALQPEPCGAECPPRRPLQRAIRWGLLLLLTACGAPFSPQDSSLPVAPSETSEDSTIQEDSSYDSSHGGSGGDEIDSGTEGDSEELEEWGEAVVTLYTFQDNSACNSSMSASDRALIPYVSVALPFRYLTDFGGEPLSMGEVIHVAFLEGRVMPDGTAHSGWVRIDDFCGDGGDDSYCLQGELPNVDLYIGDWAVSGMSCDAADPEEWGSGAFSGPGGDGHEQTMVSRGAVPESEPASGYGGAPLGAGRCGSCEDGQEVQPPACWHYDPGSENIEYCDCTNSNGVDGECG